MKSHKYNGFSAVRNQCCSVFLHWANPAEISRFHRLHTHPTTQRNSLR